MKIVALTFAALTFAFFAHAHEGHHKGPHSQAEKKQEPTIPTEVFDKIQVSYLKNVKPVFDQKCAACHASDVAAPWYASVPLVGRLVESDRSEAKEHLEISKGFPFAGHGTPLEDLDAIRESVEKDTMPTRLYRTMHPSSVLNKVERSTILNWVDESKKLLATQESKENAK